MQRFQWYCTELPSATGSAKGRFPRLKAVMFSGIGQRLAGADLFAENHIGNRDAPPRPLTALPHPRFLLLDQVTEDLRVETRITSLLLAK
jgi:hypothetical protein